MVTVIDFVVELVGSLIELTVIFATEVAARDPLAFVIFAVGALLTTFSILVMGYLAAGAFVDALGIGGATRPSGPRRDEESLS